jgi:hypothetical protein
MRYYGANATSERFPRELTVNDRITQARSDNTTICSHAPTPMLAGFDRPGPLDYLLRLYADIGQANKAEAERLTTDMRHVEAVIKMFDLD